MTKRTVGLDEAAAILGISKDALRKRIKRGTIEAQKDNNGRRKSLGIKRKKGVLVEMRNNRINEEGQLITG